MIRVKWLQHIGRVLNVSWSKLFLPFVLPSSTTWRVFTQQRLQRGSKKYSYSPYILVRQPSCQTDATLHNDTDRGIVLFFSSSSRKSRSGGLANSREPRLIDSIVSSSRRYNRCHNLYRYLSITFGDRRNELRRSVKKITVKSIFEDDRWTDRIFESLKFPKIRCSTS